MILRIGDVGCGELFNLTHEWFIQCSHPSNLSLDVKVEVRFRGFGSNEAKQAAWDRDWRSLNPTWGPVSQCNVSSNPPEIWFDLRETENGIIIPPHILGHEIGHVLKLEDPRVVNPDTFAAMKS